MTDDITKSILNLSGEMPEARLELTEIEKDKLIAQVGGPLTTRNIVSSKKHSPLSRIPFLFNSIDTQLVVDILANDMSDAIQRALEAKKQAKLKGKK